MNNKQMAEGKGVYREVKSEENCRQTRSQTNRNLIRHMRVSLPNKMKSKVTWNSRCKCSGYVEGKSLFF